MWKKWLPDINININNNSNNNSNINSAGSSISNGGESKDPKREEKEKIQKLISDYAKLLRSE